MLPGAFALCCLLPASAGAGERMNGDQLRELLSDVTTYGKHAFKDLSGNTYRRADGTFVGRHSKKGARSGTWTVVGDEYYRHPKGEENGCRTVFNNGDGSYDLHRKKGGSLKHVWTWGRVVPGNPENL